ncbi:transposase [Borreliella bissettiae]|uniref:transposase n=1 Tax=Borrelia bissettiae TaxID=64897 RepID=UPI0039864EA4
MCYSWKITLNEFNHDKDHIHLLLEFTANIQPSKFINNLKTVSSRLIRKNILLI